MTPLRESVLAAVETRLASLISDVPVERARRAPVDISEFPRLIIHGLDASPDLSQSPMETFWTFGFSVTGYVKAATDLAAEQALSDLHASVMAALENADLGPGAVQPTAGAADMALYPAEDSKTPAGQFTVVFQALAIAPTSYPYAP
jgi:hypothetical protein